MICPPCRANAHSGCTGKGQCDCQHRAPRGREPQPCGAGVWVIKAGRDDEVQVCGQTPARLYACGWRCEDCKP